jgi:HEPN domain-containing protein
MNSILKNWIQVAENDLKSAIVLERDSLFETACYHCQQAAEKYLKAYLIHAEIEPPITHDLTRLVAIAKTVESEFEALEEAATALSDYATLYRYPADVPVTCTEEDTKEAIEKAQGVKAFVMGRIKPDDTSD